MCYGSQWAKKRSSGCCKPKRLGAPSGRAGVEVKKKTHPWIPPIIFYHKIQNRKLIAGTISWHQNCISRVDWHSWRYTQNGQAHVLRWRQRSPRLRWTMINLLKALQPSVSVELHEIKHCAWQTSDFCSWSYRWASLDQVMVVKCTASSPLHLQ